MGYPRGFLGTTFPAAFGTNLLELDMCLYNGTTLPPALQRVPNVVKLFMDRSVFMGVSVEDVMGFASSTPMLEELSVTGVVGMNWEGFSSALLQHWNRLRALYIGETELMWLPTIPALVMLDASKAEQVQWMSPHPIRMAVLRCIVLGSSLDFDSHDYFPAVEYVDIRHVSNRSSSYSMFTVPPSVVLPRLRRVCVQPYDLPLCRQWVDGSNVSCTASDTCRNDVSVCGLPKYPVKPPARTWGGDVVTSIPFETAQCTLCRSTCYSMSVAGTTPPPKPSDA